MDSKRFQISGPYYSYASPYGEVTMAWNEYFVTDSQCGHTWKDEKGDLFIPNTVNIKEYPDNRCSIVQCSDVFRFVSLENAVQWAEDYLVKLGGGLDHGITGCNGY